MNDFDGCIGCGDNTANGKDLCQACIDKDNRTLGAIYGVDLD